MSKRFTAFILAVTVLVLYAVSIVPAGAAGEQEMYNFPFSDEAAQGELFTFGDSVTGQWVTGAGVGHGDDAAIKLTHTEGTAYTSAVNTLILTLPEPLPAGGVYKIVAWVYASSADNAGKSTMTGPGFVINSNYGGEQGFSKFPADFGTLPVDEWKEINVTLPVQEEAISQLDFRLVINDEPKHPDVWYWDNIEIYQIGDVVEVTPPVSEDGYPLVTRSKIATHDDFDYELWSQRGTDAVNMVLTGGGTFRCDWEALNVLFRMGKKLGSKQSYKEYGDITLQYTAEYNITKGDVNYLCMYGWTEDPMIEFYIIESHGNYKPPGGIGFTGSYELDGGTYEVYVDTRVEQPSIQGTKTFQQYFAVRTDKRTEGTLSISEHFKEWEKLGLDMSGKMYEVSLCVEGYSSAGNAKIAQHMLTIGDTVYGSPDVVSAGPVSAEPTATEVPEATETLAPATETPLPSPSPAATEAPTDDKPSNLPLILGIVVAVVIVGIVVFLTVTKKRPSSKK